MNSDTILRISNWLINGSCLSILFLPLGAWWEYSGEYGNEKEIIEHIYVFNEIGIFLLFSSFLIGWIFIQAFKSIKYSKLIYRILIVLSFLISGYAFLYGVIPTPDFTVGIGSLVLLGLFPLMMLNKYLNLQSNENA